MIKAQWSELKPLLVKKLNPSLVIKAWNMYNFKSDMKWLRFDKLDELAIEVCNVNNWDPDTTLMLYSPPRDNPNCEPVSQETIDHELDTLSLSNKVLCICSFYQNMTLEKMAKALNQIHNLKAFL